MPAPPPAPPALDPHAVATTAAGAAPAATHAAINVHHQAGAGNLPGQAQAQPEPSPSVEEPAPVTGSDDNSSIDPGDLPPGWTIDPSSGLMLDESGRAVPPRSVGAAVQSAGRTPGDPIV